MDLELSPLRSECCCLLQVYNKPGSVYAENLNAGTNYGQDSADSNSKQMKEIIVSLPLAC